jgi:hypothetical protein
MTESKEEVKNAREAVNWFQPSEIASSAYQSLDEQVSELRKIPPRVKEEAKKLFDILHDENRDVLRNPKDIEAFRAATSEINTEVGLAWDALRRMDRDQNKSQPDLQLPMLPSMTSPNLGTAQLPATGGQPIVVKHGWGSAFWEHRTQGRWAKAFEHAVDVQRQPEITSTNVKDVRAYGEELQAEWALLLEFHYKATKLIRYRDDEPTYRDLIGEIILHSLKLSNITKAFTTTVVEYRTDEYGDRKVGVAAGAMWLEAAKARMLPVPGWSGAITPTSDGATSQTVTKRPRGGPYTPEMSSGVTEHE